MVNLAANGGSALVPEIETNTLLLGGPGGPLNQQAQALLNLIAALGVSSLTDVSVTEGASIDQYSLVWNNATSKWIAKNVGGGGLSDFTDSLATSSPNATVPVATLSASNAATNVDFSVVPKGSGALQLAIPDGAVTGGNKRGANAVDLQTSRNAATQVASGINSTVVGGLRNTASGGYSFTGGGNSNVASGSYSAALGGSSNTASGSYSAAVGGTGCVANSQNSVSLGGYATTNSIAGQVAFGHNSIVLGQFQRTFTQVRASTTSTAATVATADGGAATSYNQLTLRNKSAFRVRLYAVAFDATNFSDAKEWTGDVLITRGATAASTAIVGSPTVTSTFMTSGASGWTLAVSADTTNGALKVTVTSSTTDTVDWNIELDAVEVM